MISIALCDDTLVEEFDKDQARIDNFFLDFYMKKLNGAETALQIRQFNDKCPIVFVTSALDNLYEMMQSSPVDIIEKPAKKEKVFEVLDQVLGHTA